MPGPWEWTVSIGLVMFYLFMGWSLLGKFSEPVPDAMRYAFMAVLVAMAGLSLPFKHFDGSHSHIPWRDWVFAALASGFSLYLLVFFENIYIEQPGQHTPLDLMMGVIAIAMVIEATRRTMGIFLPLLAIGAIFMAYWGLICQVAFHTEVIVSRALWPICTKAQKVSTAFP